MTPLVFRNLTSSKLRTAAACGGVGVCTLLVLVQLGFYQAALDGATAIYQTMDYDAVLVSPSYVCTVESDTIPRRRVVQALASPDVAEAIPVYFGLAPWRSSVSLNKEIMVVVGVEPGQRVFRDPELEAALLTDLRRADAVFTGRGSQPVVRSIDPGQAAEMLGKRVRVAGQYEAGPGFLGAGTLVTSLQGFQSVFPTRSLGEVNVALLRARSGVDPERMVQGLRALLPDDVRVLTAAELTALEQEFWREHAKVQVLFLTGVAVAMLTGLVILYQILAADVLSRLKEYATLRAMGYDDRRLSGIVMKQALSLGLLGYAIGFPLALGMYGATRAATHMNMFMTVTRAGSVLLGVAVVSAFSASLATKKLRAADPAELF